MKKKVMILGALLLAVVVTGYSVSGTYAKYVTALDSFTDSARVAKWGVKANTPTMTEVNLFSNNYTDAAAVEDIVAPGTSGSYSFQVQYNDAGGAGDATPEVDYKIVLNATGSDTVKDTTTASRIKYSLDDDNYDLTLAQLLEEINGLSTDKITAGTSIKSALTSDDSLKSTHTIKWTWPFETTGDRATQDGYDTNLGDEEEAKKVEIKVSISVVQDNSTEEAKPNP